MAAATIDEYLAALPDPERVVLERLRGQIRLAAPEATEGIAYGAPAFRLDGRYLLGFAATKVHLSLYCGRAPLDSHTVELAGYRLWKGTINFPVDRPLPEDLVSSIVRTRVAESRSGGD
jgi:uncharacterized protein YdhG (YjbR/CyaY superfamily)